MKYTAIRPLLWTAQFEETIAFYTTILGFALGEKNDHWGWANLIKDNVEIMLARPNEHLPFERPVFTGSIYISTDNVDRVWEWLKDKAKIVYEIEDFEWEMREFAIYDNNGYIIQFGQYIGNQEA